MMNNSLSSKGQLIPTCSDAIAARLLARLLLSLAENVCRCRDWQPETRRGRKMAGVSSCLSSICKKSKFPIGDMIVIKTNRKKTDECINQNTAEHRWGAAVSGVVVGGRSSSILKPLYEICMSFSSWQRGHGWTRGSGKSIVSADQSNI